MTPDRSRYDDALADMSRRAGPPDHPDHVGGLPVVARVRSRPREVDQLHDAKRALLDYSRDEHTAGGARRLTDIGPVDSTLGFLRRHPYLVGAVGVAAGATLLTSSSVRSGIQRLARGAFKGLVTGAVLKKLRSDP